MNTFAGVMLLLWLGGWTLAMVLAGVQAKAVALAPVRVFPGKPLSSADNRK